MEMQVTLASARDIRWDFLILGVQETLAKQTTIWSHQQVHAKPGSALFHSGTLVPAQAQVSLCQGSANGACLATYALDSQRAPEG